MIHLLLKYFWYNLIYKMLIAWTFFDIKNSIFLHDIHLCYLLESWQFEKRDTVSRKILSTLKGKKIGLFAVLNSPWGSFGHDLGRCFQIHSSVNNDILWLETRTMLRDRKDPQWTPVFSWKQTRLQCPFDCRFLDEVLDRNPCSKGTVFFCTDVKFGTKTR